MSTTPSWSKQTEAQLVAAGWDPNRRDTQRVATWRQKMTGFQMFPAAEKVLEEFGGLSGGIDGPGLQCARGDFAIDPELATSEEDRFSDFHAAVGGPLYPLGEAYHGHDFLAIDERGRVYLLMDTIQLVGADIYEALDAILVGRRPKDIAKP